MKRRSRCAWMPMLPWPIWPLAGHARLGQNVVVGSMTILLSWWCWGASQEEVCLDPCFLCNLTPPRFSVELPGHDHPGKSLQNASSAVCPDAPTRQRAALEDPDL